MMHIKYGDDLLKDSKIATMMALLNPTRYEMPETLAPDNADPELEGDNGIYEYGEITSMDIELEEQESAADWTQHVIKEQVSLRLTTFVVANAKT